MTPRQLLSPQARGALFDPPTDPAAIVRHYTFLPEDMVVIRRRRRDANRLGFAVHLAYLRFPGRVIGVGENPPLDMLCFIAEQIGVSDRDFEDYATRLQTPSGSSERTPSIPRSSALSTGGLSSDRQSGAWGSDRH
jgi:TnpA family transposase